METGTGAIPRISPEAFRIIVTCGLNRFLSKGITEFTDGQEQGKNYYESLSNGVYFIGKLPYGKYYLVETQAPTDYSTNNTGKVFILTVNAGGVADPEAKGTIAVNESTKVQENLKAWVAQNPTA